MTLLVLFPALIVQTLLALSLPEDPSKGPVSDYAGTATIHAYQDDNVVNSSTASKSGGLYSSSVPSEANVGYVQNNVFIGLP